MQIPSYDSNSHCLCVAGEVYCWWQTYHSSTDSLAALPSSPSTTKDSYTFESSTGSIENLEASGEVPEEMIDERISYFENNTTNTSESPAAPATCNIMGKVFKKGNLKHFYRKNSINDYIPG